MGCGVLKIPNSERSIVAAGREEFIVSADLPMSFVAEVGIGGSVV